MPSQPQQQQQQKPQQQQQPMMMQSQQPTPQSYSNPGSQQNVQHTQQIEYYCSGCMNPIQVEILKIMDIEDYENETILAKPTVHPMQWRRQLQTRFP